MELGNKYIIISLSVTIMLLIIFIVLALFFNQLNSVFNILAVLIGSSITIFLTLILENKRFEEKQSDIVSSISAEIAYNLEISEKNLDILENEVRKIKAGIIDENEFYMLPLHPLKTDMWNLLRIDDEEKIVGEHLQKILDISMLTEFIADLFRIRENFIFFRNEVNPLFIEHYDHEIIDKLKILIKITKEFIDKDEK